MNGMSDNEKHPLTRRVPIVLQRDTWVLLESLLNTLNYNRILQHEPAVDLPCLIAATLECFLREHEAEIVEHFHIAISAAARSYAARRIPAFLHEVAGITGIDPSELRESDLSDRDDYKYEDKLIHGTAKRSSRTTTRLPRTSGGACARATSHTPEPDVGEGDNGDSQPGRTTITRPGDADVRRAYQIITGLAISEQHAELTSRR